jgi:PAS domain S-box-containing protein
MADNKTKDFFNYPSRDDIEYQRWLQSAYYHKQLRRRMRKKSPLKPVFWGLLLILIAILLYLNKQNVIGIDNWWQFFIIGLGAVFLIQGLVYLASPQTRPFIWGRLIPGLILLFLGLSFVLGMSVWWPLALVAVGLVILFSAWFLHKEAEKHKIVEENLHESEIKYSHILENANSFIIEADSTGNIMFCNKFAREFLGFNQEEIQGRNLLGTIIPDNSTTDRKSLIKDIIGNPQSYLHRETETQLKNGETAWITWTYKPIFDESNNLIEILCTGIDSTEKKKGEEQAARRLMEQTASEERIRLARDLHDAVSQTLFSASLIADVLPRLWEKNHDEALKRLDELRRLTRGALGEMRTLLFELRPSALENAAFGDLLRHLAEAASTGPGLTVSLELEGNAPVPADIKVAFYRIAQEALNNIKKHSGADHARLLFSGKPDEILLQITDNGRGFDTAQEPAGGFGLGNIRERANAVGASVTIESKPDQGTVITIIRKINTGEIKP